MAMIVLVVAGIFSPMLAHEPLDGEFTCPICHKTYMDIFLAPQPFYITMGGLGQGPELRSWSYMGPGHYWAMCCPFCGYANTSTGFHLVYQDHEERRENPFEPNNCKAPQPATAPAPVREPSQTQPAGAGAASRPAPHHRAGRAE